jgi:antitoxin component HigA of HigAB toxin-antitoxin module
MKRNFNCMKILFILTITIFTLSCKNKKEKEQEQVTTTEAKDFARQLQISIEKKDATFFDNAIDKETFLQKIGLNKAGKDAEGFKRGLSDKMKIGSQLISTMTKGSNYQLVKQYEKDKIQHLIFRLYDQGSLNYHDLELGKHDKEVKIDDLYVYTTGELLSETLNTLYNQMKSFMVSGQVNKDDNWLAKVPQIRQKMNAGDYTGALRDFESLPEEIQKLKSLSLMHIMITSGLNDDAAYSAAINEYQKLFPNEPNMHLILIDGYIINKEYDKALESVNKLDERINKDPFLDFYRYLISNLKEDKINAKKYIISLVNNIPDFEDGMIELILTYKEDGETEKADSLIKSYKLHNTFDQSKLNSVLDL